MNRLEGLQWKPKWVSHLGCVQGCLRYLDKRISDAWLFGATGHAFVINVHEVLCPSGPTAWNTEMVSKLGKNVGYLEDIVFSLKSHDDFAEKQEQAWEHVKRSIDEGFPCYAWELDIPEFYVIHGYDDTGYHFSGPGCDSGKGPKPWKELGDTGIGCLEVYSVRPAQAADDRKAVREALEFAGEHATNPEKWVFPKYNTGLAGFDTWIDALETGKADGFGMAFNAQVWSECRDHAVSFLKEAKERIGAQTAPLFDEAREHYEVVAAGLKKAADAFPFFGMKPEHIKDPERVRTGLESLKTARDAEGLGLESLEKIANSL